jgi:hypothetical protein
MKDIRDTVLTQAAEIARLKAENEILRAANASFEGGRVWRDGLIGELADALEFPYHSSKLPALIHRAREAIT